MRGCLKSGGMALMAVARRHGGRGMGTTGRGANRAAEHGHRSPATSSINVEEAEEEINKGKEEKRRKTEQVERKLDDSTDVKGSTSVDQSSR